MVLLRFISDSLMNVLPVSSLESSRCELATSFNLQVGRNLVVAPAAAACWRRQPRELLAP